MPLNHPLAWVEVQGYAWAAYASYLQLAKKRGGLELSLEQEIQSRMNGLLSGLQRFWLEDEHIPAIALDGQKQTIMAVSSNPGHLLWSGCNTLPHIHAVILKEFVAVHCGETMDRNSSKIH